MTNAVIDIFLHPEKYLSSIIANFGFGIYAFLFLAIFIETGIVIFPFLPGDSLLFAAGALAAAGNLNIFIIITFLFVAAFLGDTLNYWIGYKFGRGAFGKSRLFNEKYLERTENFYDEHGARTIVIARFIPIIRTFAPFVAGIGKMPYSRFIKYNLFGGFIWVALFSVAGYLFSNIPFVKSNLSLMIIAIILVSLIPLVYEWVVTRRKK